jgi:hypothetical protein
VKRKEDRKERIFLAWAKVRSLTNPTVCSYRPAEILRKKAQFQQKTGREGKVNRRTNVDDKQTGR